MLICLCYAMMLIHLLLLPKWSFVVSQVLLLFVRVVFALPLKIYVRLLKSGSRTIRQFFSKTKQNCAREILLPIEAGFKSKKTS